MRPGRSYRQCSMGQLVYLVVTLLGLLTGIGFAVNGIRTDWFNTEDTSYFFIFAINCCFACMHAIQGIRQENPYDLVILVLSVGPPIFYIIVDVAIGHKTILKLVSCIPLLTCILALAQVRLVVGLPFACFIVGFGVYHLRKFFLSKHFIGRYGIEETPSTEYTPSRTRSDDNSGANNEQTRCLGIVLLFYFLISVNLQIDFSAVMFTLTSGFAVQLKSGKVLHTDMIFVFFGVVFIAALACVSAYLCVSSFYAFCSCPVRKESGRLMAVFATASTALVAAGVYLLVQSAIDMDKTGTDHILSGIALGISILMIYVRIITCIGSYLTYVNFGKGFKEAFYGVAESEQMPLVPETCVGRLGLDNSIQN